MKVWLAVNVLFALCWSLNQSFSVSKFRQGNYFQQMISAKNLKTRCHGLCDGSGDDPTLPEMPIFTGTCGVPAIHPKIHGKIVGGEEAKPHSWPWQVSLRLENDAHDCGGVIINEQWIVSAAHCTRWSSGPGTIVAGMHNINDKHLPRREVMVVVPHEKYDYGTNDQDIMLIKLKEPLVFSDEISPVCLPEQNEEFRPGKRLFTTGWGDLQYHGQAAKVLQQVSAQLIPRDTCNAWYNEEPWFNDALTENMMCAGYEEGGRDSCQGDSGGPLVAHEGDEWKLAGVVSWGYGCAFERRPGIYTKVSNYVDWIQKNIAKHSHDV